MFGNGGKNCAGIGLVSGYEHDLPLPRQGGIRPELSCRQMIEGFYEACPDKCLGHDFRREKTSLFLRSDMKGIRKVDNDLAVPVVELLRNIRVSRKGDSEEDHLGLTSVLNGLGNDVGT